MVKISTSNKNLKIIFFLLLSISLFHVNLSGKFFFFDLISLLTLSYIFINRQKIKILLFEIINNNKILLFILVLLIINQVIQDLINYKDFISFIKGNLKFINLFGCTLFLLIIEKKINLFNLNNTLILPLSISLILVYIFQPNIHAIDGDFWKFGVGYPFVLLMFLLITNKFILIIYSFILLAISILLNAKSLALIILILLIYNILKILSKLNKFYLLLICIFISIISFNKINSEITNISILLDNIYVSNKINNNLIKDQNQKQNQIQDQNQVQNSTIAEKNSIKDINIKSGRKDFFNGLNYIINNAPFSIFIGTGTINKSDIISIKTHSHMIGDAVEYGGLLLLIWSFAIIFLIYNLYLNLYKYNLGDNDSIYILVNLLLLWDILFSPFSGDHRFISLIYFMYVYFIFKKQKCTQ